MAFLRRFFGGQSARVPFDIAPDGFLEVAGVAHHKENLARIYSRSEEAVIEEGQAELWREPGNRYDPNAVQVRIAGRLVGYLPREAAPAWSAWLASYEAQGRVARVRTHVWRRWGAAYAEPTAYIHLLIHEDPAELARREAEEETRTARRQEREEDRLERARQRAEQHGQRVAEVIARAEQEHAWRMAGLCAGCGGPLLHGSGRRGRPSIYCDACRAAGKGRAGVPGAT